MTKKTATQIKEKTYKSINKAYKLLTIAEKNKAPYLAKKFKISIETVYRALRLDPETQEIRATNKKKGVWILNQKQVEKVYDFLNHFPIENRCEIISKTCTKIGLSSPTLYKIKRNII